jgi:hypothetical protein
MILEGIVTTLNEDGSPNISPMGPIVDREITKLQLRPFQTSRTYQNLARQGEGVFHVTDDVELLARAAIGRLDPIPAWRPATAVHGAVLCDACRWYAFRVIHRDDSQTRTTIDCQIVDTGRQRDFFGLNRAKHAVVEAAILATRLHLLDRTDVLAQLAQLEILIEKTAGDQERRAFELIKSFV